MYSKKYLDKEIERLKKGKKTRVIITVIIIMTIFLIKYLENGFDYLSVYLLTAVFLVTLSELEKLAIFKRMMTKDKCNLN